jgi:hypothetical protein
VSGVAPGPERGSPGDRLLRWAARVPVPARRPGAGRPSFVRLAAVLILASLLVGEVVAVLLLT